MPLYEYVCDDCKRGFEKLVRTWSESVTCPECDSTAVEKQLSSFAVQGGGPSPARGGCGCGRGGCGCGH
jgi:putative FmdB family regulatory protein